MRFRSVVFPLPEGPAIARKTRDGEQSQQSA
jgi:hypothetical protein